MRPPSPAFPQIQERDLGEGAARLAYLDGLQARVSALRAARAETEKELYALLPSILDKAFKGEL